MEKPFLKVNATFPLGEGFLPLLHQCIKGFPPSLRDNSMPLLAFTSFEQVDATTLVAMSLGRNKTNNLSKPSCGAHTPYGMIIVDKGKLSTHYG